MESRRPKITEWIIVLSALGAIIALLALGAFGALMYNTLQIGEIHISLNSRLTELLDVTKKSARAEGLKQGQEENIPH